MNTKTTGIAVVVFVGLVYGLFACWDHVQELRKLSREKLRLQEHVQNLQARVTEKFVSAELEGLSEDDCKEQTAALSKIADELWDCRRYIRNADTRAELDKVSKNFDRLKKDAAALLYKETPENPAPIN